MKPAWEVRRKRGHIMIEAPSRLAGTWTKSQDLWLSLPQRHRNVSRSPRSLNLLPLFIKWSMLPALQ